MERTMLAKTTIALATAAVLGVASVAQAATKDKGNKAGLVRGSIMQLLHYERYGSPRFFRDEPQTPTPAISNDLEGYPHPK
jgi:hypothetical protein